MSFRRSFTDDAYMNRRIPDSIPVAANSAFLTSTQAKSCPPPKIGKPTGAWAIPWSEKEGSTDVATIIDVMGNTVKIAVDIHIGSMSGDDAAVVWRDLSRNVEVATFETVIPRKSDGSINTRLPIKCKGYAIYYTNTNGLAKQVGGDSRNTGHRGITPSSMALHPGESTIISRRLKCSLGQPGDSPGPNHPMYGIETPRSGAIPEGATLRYMGPITNFVLQAAHDYGFIVGDTANEGVSVVKTVQGGVYTSAILKALDGTTWDQWVVMQLGWKVPALTTPTKTRSK